MRAGRALRSLLYAALLVHASLLAQPALAQDPSWRPAASFDFNAGTNWTGGNPPQPGETATFGFSLQTSLTTSADASVGGFTFNVGASNYTLLNNDLLEITGAGIVINGGGFTLINNADLEFSGTSSAGSASIINNCCMAFFDSSNAGTATISNDGSLTFADTSSAASARITNSSFGLVLFENLSTAGNASITNDGVVLFFDNSTAGNATIINNFAMMFDDASTAGNARITTNAGLQFLGSSTAGTATIINNCCLMFGADSSAASATVITNSGGSTSFFDNASGGSARFVLNAGGVLDISGLLTGGTTAGSIEGAGNIDLGDKALTVGSLNTSTTFSGVIDGFAGSSLEKVGSGVLTLSGINTYTGPTTVIAGTLVVDGSLASDVTVSPGAWLKGSGEIGTLAIMAGGVHAPGNSIGTQIINGTYVNAGTLQVEVNAAGQSDLLIVTGVVDITGAILQVVALPGGYGPSLQYVIIQNDGGAAVVGNFSLVTSSLAFLTPSVITNGGDGDDVVLTLTRNAVAFTDVALTPNQKAVAGALQNGFFSGNFSDGANVISALLGLSASDARHALDLLSGEIHASIAHVLFGQSRHLSSLASERLWHLGSGTTQAALQQGSLMGLGMVPGEMHEAMAHGAQADQGERPRASRVGAWVRGLGELASIEGDGNAGEIKSRTGGVIVGGDVPVAPGIIVGLMGGWTTSDADVDSRTSKAEVDGGHVAAYARATLGDMFLKGLASYSHHTLDVTRHMAFGGLARTVRADYGADQVTLYGEAAWHWRLGGFGVMPLTALRWSHLDVDGFTEQGAGALNLTSGGATYDALDAIAGVRIGTTVMAGNMTWMPQARVLWTHTFGDVGPRLGLGLEGGGAFIVRGLVRDRDVLTLGGGLNAVLGEAAFGYIDYAAHLSDSGREHALTAGLRVRY